jgi:23S rRNA pseudouridine2605 synthase
MNVEVRLNRALSMLGICSRRDGDKKIMSGSVSVNGRVVTDLGRKVGMKDVISVDGKEYTLAMEPEPKVWIYNKPRGLVTSHHDEKGRKSVFDDLKTKINERVISVGRLDIDSEGLLLITNNPQFARSAETSRCERHYEVRVFGDVCDKAESELKRGGTVDGVRYKPLIIKSIENAGGRNSWIKCVIREGKNREIRKLFGYFGLTVSRLIRCQYGPYELGSLQKGDVKLVTITNAWQ